MSGPPIVREDTPRSLLHPEWVGGRRLWMESAMASLIDKLHHGDPVRGWEGDPRLAVYWAPPCWEVMRLEADGQYRLVCRSTPGTPFDERLIEALVAHDRQRGFQLHERIVNHNEQLDADHRAALDARVTEDVAPRLRHALRSEL
jgi:hypothetical protein